MWIEVLWFKFYLGMKLYTVRGLLIVCAQENGGGYMRGKKKECGQATVTKVLTFPLSK